MPLGSSWRWAGASLSSFAIASAVAQSPGVPDYLEQLTRENTTVELLAFSELTMLVGRNAKSPDDAVQFASSVYGLDQSDASSLIALAKAADDDMRNAAGSEGMDERAICNADIRSAEEYASWWERLADGNNKRYAAMVRFVSSRLEPSVWATFMRRIQAEWSTRETFGVKTNYEKLVEAEDYRVLLRRACG